MEEIKIHDIKGLVDIPDFSFYIYSILWILGSALLFIFVFLLYKYFDNKSKNRRKAYYKILKELDLNDSRNSAYLITKYARLLSQSDREKKLSHELIDELENFKYKKEIKPLSDEVKILFGRFMDSVDV